jgi:hypothetical protein
LGKGSLTRRAKGWLGRIYGKKSKGALQLRTSKYNVRLLASGTSENQFMCASEGIKWPLRARMGAMED